MEKSTRDTSIAQQWSGRDGGELPVPRTTETVEGKLQEGRRFFFGGGRCVPQASISGSCCAGWKLGTRTRVGRCVTRMKGPLVVKALKNKRKKRG